MPTPSPDIYRRALYRGRAMFGDLSAASLRDINGAVAALGEGIQRELTLWGSQVSRGWRSKAALDASGQIVHGVYARANNVLQEVVSSGRNVSYDTTLSIWETAGAEAAAAVGVDLAGFGEVFAPPITLVGAFENIGGAGNWRTLLTAHAGRGAAEASAIVRRGLLEGIGPDELGRRMRLYVQGSQGFEQLFTDVPTLTGNVAKIDLRTIPRSVRGGAKEMVQNARRIGFSEIHNARHEAGIQHFRADPLIRAVKWRLSPNRGLRFKPPDQCDYLARGNFHGLGPGVYPVRRVPAPPHPYDRCELQPLTRSSRRAGQPKPDPPFKWKDPKVPGASRLTPRARARIEQAVRGSARLGEQAIRVTGAPPPVPGTSAAAPRPRVWNRLEDVPAGVPTRRLAGGRRMEVLESVPTPPRVAPPPAPGPAQPPQIPRRRAGAGRARTRGRTRTAPPPPEPPAKPRKRKRTPQVKGGQPLGARPPTPAPPPEPPAPRPLPEFTGKKVLTGRDGLEWARYRAQRLGVEMTATVTDARAMHHALDAMEDLASRGYKLPPKIWTPGAAAKTKDTILKRVARKVRGVVAAYWDFGRTMWLKSDLGSKASLLTGEVQFEGGFWSGNHQWHTVRHEVAHYLHSEALRDLGIEGFPTTTFRQAAKTAGLPESKAALIRVRLAKQVSRYAAYNPEEMVAEMFAGAMEGRKYTEDLWEIYRAIGGPPLQGQIPVAPVVSELAQPLSADAAAAALRRVQKPVGKFAREALEAYRRAGYGPINEALRNHGGNFRSWATVRMGPNQSQIRTVGGFRGTPKEIATHFRNHSASLRAGMEDIRLGRPVDLYRAGAASVEDLKVGSTIRDNGFISTTTDRNVARRFLEGGATDTGRPAGMDWVMYRIRTPVGGFRGMWVNEAAPGVGSASDLELILEPGAQFRVTKVAKTARKLKGAPIWEVEVELVP